MVSLQGLWRARTSLMFPSCPPVCRAEPGVNHGPGEDQGRREWSAQSYVWKVSVRHVVAATSHPMADLMFHSFFSSQPASGLMWELPLLPLRLCPQARHHRLALRALAQPAAFAGGRGLFCLSWQGPEARRLGNNLQIHCICFAIRTDIDN